MVSSRSTSSDESEVHAAQKECRCVPECRSDRGGNRHTLHLAIDMPGESQSSVDSSPDSTSELSSKSSSSSDSVGKEQVAKTTGQSLPRKSPAACQSRSQKTPPSISSASTSGKQKGPSQLAVPHDCNSIPGASSDKEAVQKGTSVRSVNAYNVYYGEQKPRSMYTVSTKRSAVSKKSGSGSKQMKTTERTKVGLFELSIDKGRGRRPAEVTGALSTDIAKELDFHLDSNTKPTGPEDEQQAVREKSRKSVSSKRLKSAEMQPAEQEPVAEKSRKTRSSKKLQGAEILPAEEESPEAKVEASVGKSRKSGSSKKLQGAEILPEGEEPPKVEASVGKSRKSGFSKKSEGAEIEQKQQESPVRIPEAGDESSHRSSEAVTIESHPDFLDKLIIKYMYKMKKAASRNSISRDNNLISSTIQTMLKGEGEEVPTQTLIWEKVSKNSRGLYHELVKLSVEIDAIHDFANFLHRLEKVTNYDCEKNGGLGGLPKFTPVSIGVMIKMSGKILAVIKELSKGF